MLLKNKKLKKLIPVDKKADLIYNASIHLHKGLIWYINIYLITGKNCCYLIDSGIFGSETLIFEYMNSIGRKKSDITSYTIKSGTVNKQSSKK